MDQGKFLEFLKSCQIPNTDIVKSATNELRTIYYPHPESLHWLLQILATNGAPEIRQQAAVEAHRLVPKHWASLPGDQKQAIRESILQSTLGEQAKLVRHASARVIAAMAAIDLQKGEWTDLPNLLFQASTSQQVSHRDVGTHVIYTLLEVMGDELEDKFTALFELFGTTIKDPDSADVRSNTMLALGKMAMSIHPDEHPQNLNHFIQAFPGMVAVLKTAIEEKEEDRIDQAFEVFQTLLGCESALLATHFKDLLEFMIEIAADTNQEEDARSQALSFLMQCVRYRKMKIQAIRDMGEKLTLMGLQIATEFSDEDEDDDDVVAPHRAALGLLDLLASSLPPRQVIVPLLAALPQYVNHEKSLYRQAGILGLSMCVEGAPDFVSTQLDSLMPVVLRLLNDPVVGVRRAALQGVATLADDLAEDLCKYHQELMPAFLKNLDSSNVQLADNNEQQRNIKILKSTCSALDSVVEGMSKEIITQYLPELVPRLGQLLSHPEILVKACAAGAMGSTAGSADEAFVPYFEPTMKALWEYVSIKDSDKELDTRATVCDAIGRIASAVGGTLFQPYLQHLMEASEVALHLGHSRLRETSYILWSTLSKVYEEEFTPFLDGVVKALLECLQQEETETEIELGQHAEDLVGKEVVVGGKKIKVTAATDEAVDVDGMEEDDDDDDDWEGLIAITAVAMEKEVAVEVIADAFSHTRNKFVPYFEKTVETVLGLVEHNYEGVRKMAIATLWRAYTCLWGLMEDHTGQKWTPGLPPNTPPTPELVKLGEIVTAATTSVWEDEVDRSVVTDINRNVAATLKTCGPAILAQPKFAEHTLGILGCLITRTHPCQQDLGEDDPEATQEEESSQYDWLVIDTALDVIISLSAALGAQFVEPWKVVQKPVLKFASSQTSYERSTAMGAIAECTQNMGAAVARFTDSLLKVLVHRLSDEDPETKSNAAFATGLLIYHSTNSAAYLSSYNTILAKLESLLHTEGARIKDNAAGCVSRMIMAHQDRVPLSEILPVLVDLLPLKEDYEENKPVYECICGLYQHENQTLLELTPQLIPVFAQVLSEPKDQLEDDTRALIIKTVQFIGERNPSIVQGSEQLMNALRG